MTTFENPDRMVRILFVDDEPEVLYGLRDSLRRYRREWRMRFALGADAALEEIHQEPADVVVSDMRMPGSDGATLLARVQSLHPETVRIILSGYAEAGMAARAASVAHLFLAKPCDADTLRSAIERACTVQSLLREERLRRTAAGAATLPSRPAVYTALQAAVRDPDATPAKLATIIEQDIAMCAKVLQLVNSAFFGIGRRISSVGEAVAYLGLATLETVVLSAAAFNAFAPSPQIGGFDLERLQRHSAVVANIARRLVDDHALAEDAYTAGMLHDIGLLVLADHEPGELAESIAAARTSDRPLETVEYERRHVSHAEVGAYLLALWGLPHAIVEAIAHHHRPQRIAKPTLDCVTALQIANALAREQGSSPLAGVPAEPLNQDLVEAIGAEDRLPAWREIAAQQTRESE